MFAFPHRFPAAAFVAVVAAALTAMLALFALSSRAASCTSTWNNPAGGSWATAGDWTGGEPNSSTAVACLPALSSAYTVTLTTGVTVSSVDVGGASGSNAVTLDVEGTTGNNATLSMGANSVIESTGEVLLDSTSGGSSGYGALVGASIATLTNDGSIVSQVESTNNLNFLEANLTNAAGATVEVKSGELRQDHATTTTNDGTWKVDSAVSPGFTMTNGSASFVNAAGTVSNLGAITSTGATWSQSGGAETGNAVTFNGGSLSDTGTGSSGSFVVQNVVGVSGTIASGEKVTATGFTNVSGTINAASGLVNKGTMVLDSQAGGSSGYGLLEGGPVTNDGSIVSQVESTNNLDYLEASLTNASGGTVEVKSGELRQDHATTTTNDGTWTVDSGASPGFTITNGSASFVNSTGGTVSNLGKVTVTGGTWSQSGGAETGNAVTLNNGSLTDTGTGSSGSFVVQNSVGVSGTIASGETVTATGYLGTNGVINAASGLVNKGTMVLDSQAGASSGYANLAGGPVTNDGSIVSQVESTNNLDYLEASLTNAAGATVEVKSGELRQDHATTTTNDGTWTVDSAVSPGFTITNGSASFVNSTGGTVANLGKVTVTGATWSQSGGAETGNAVTLNNGSLTDAGTGASGSFVVLNGVAVSGTIASGETVTATGITGTNGVINAASGLVNDGTIVLDSEAGASSGYANLAGGPVTNNGTLDAQVESTNNSDYLETSVTNGATGTIQVISGKLLVDHATTTTNGGDLILDPGAQMNVTNGSGIFDEQTGGTMTFEIASATSFGTLNISSGVTFTLAGGAADPALEGGYAPPVGTGFDVITGPHGAGTFTTVENNFSGVYSNTGFIELVRDKDSTGVSVGSSGPSSLGQSVTFTATLTSAPGGVGNPTGTVTFFDNGTSIGTGAVSTTGGTTTATLMTSSLAVGTHPITASYGGDSNYAASPPSSTLDQVVSKAATTTTLSSAPNPSGVGQSVTFTATVAGVPGTSPTGTVTFYDNGAQIGTGNLSTTAGVTTATYSTSTLALGTHPITAGYGGDANYTSSATSSPLDQVVSSVTLIATTTTLASSANPSTLGEQITLTATVTHATGSGSPGGSVTFYDSGTPLGLGSLSTSGGTTTATLQTSALALGTHSLTATYGGDSVYAGSTTSAPVSQVVNQAASGTSVASSLNPSTVGRSVTFTATVTGVSGVAAPTGTVTFFDNGASIGTGMLATAGGTTTATLTTSSLAVGTHPITAGYAGDANYAASTSTPALSQVVHATATSTALASSANPSTVGQSVTYTATVSPVPSGGTVAFRDGGAGISGCAAVSVSTSTGKATCAVSYAAAGSHSITAAYSGAGTFAASTAPALTQVVQATAPTSSALTVTLAGTGKGTVTSAPSGIDCGTTCSASFAAGASVTLTAAAAPGSSFTGWSGGGCSGAGPCTVTMSAARSVTATFALQIDSDKLFCGVNHRGKCLGIDVKTIFASPGNAVWVFYLYNVRLGPGAGAASVRTLTLGSVARHLANAGAATASLAVKGRIARLVAKGRREHLTGLAVRTTFTTSTGARATTTRTLSTHLG